MSFWPFCCKKEQAYGITNSPLLNAQFCGGTPGLEDNPQQWKFLSDHAGIREDGTLWTWNTPVAEWQNYIRGGSGTADRSQWNSPDWSPSFFDSNFGAAPGSLNRPIQVGSDSDWKEVSGFDPLICLKDDGSLWTVGSNRSGLLGIGLHAYDGSGTDGNAYRAKISSSIVSFATLSRLQPPFDGARFLPDATEENPWGGEVQGVRSVMRSSAKPTLVVQSRYVRPADNSGWIRQIGAIASGEPGNGADVECDWKGSIDKIDVLNQGSDYTYVPTVTVKPPADAAPGSSTYGATATVTKMSLAPVVGFSVGKPGSGYTHATATETFTGTTAEAVIGENGEIVRWNTTHVGASTANHLNRWPLRVTITGDGVGAVATPVIGKSVVEEISPSNNPECWTSKPLLEVSGGVAEEAKAVATITGDIDSVTVTNGGLGYTKPPQVVFYGGGGTGASGVASVSDGRVTSVSITSRGSGYLHPPSVRFYPAQGDAGNGAQADATLKMWVDRIIVRSKGKGYASPPVVTISPPTKAGGQQATATAVLNDVFELSRIDITNPGSGYDVPPSVAISNTGATAATAVVSRIAGEIFNKLRLVSGGTGYTQGAGASQSGQVRVFVSAIPGDGEELTENFPGGGNGTPVASVVLSESGVSSVIKKPEAIWTGGQSDASFGSDHRIAEPGKVLPFEFFVSGRKPNGGSYTCAKHVDAFLLGPGSREVPLTKTVVYPNIYKFSLDSETGGYPYPPFIVLKYSDVYTLPGETPLDQDPSDGWRDVAFDDGDARHMYYGYGSELFIFTSIYDKGFRIVGDELTAKGPVHEQEAVFKIVDGVPKLKSRQFKKSGSNSDSYWGFFNPIIYDAPFSNQVRGYNLEGQGVGGGAVDLDWQRSNELIHCVIYNGGCSKPGEFTGPFFNYVGYPPQQQPAVPSIFDFPLGPDSNGFDILNLTKVPWRGPSIDQKTFFYFPKPCTGDAAYAEAPHPTTHGDQGRVGVGDINVVRSGSGYSEEPVAMVATNFYPEPVKVSGTWLSASMRDQSSVLAVNTAGELMWWGHGTANARHRLTNSFDSTYDASPSPIAGGVVIDESTEPSPVASVASTRVYISAPDYGTWLAQFGGASPLLYGNFDDNLLYIHRDSLRPCDTLWSPLVAQNSLGLGYRDGVSATFLKCGDPVYTPVARVVGEKSFDKVCGRFARDTDGWWYDVATMLDQWSVGIGPTRPSFRESIAFSSEGFFFQKDDWESTPPWLHLTESMQITDRRREASYVAFITSGGSGYSTTSVEFDFEVVKSDSQYSGWLPIPPVGEYNSPYNARATRSRTLSTTNEGGEVDYHGYGYQPPVRQDTSVGPWSVTLYAASPPTVTFSGDGQGAAMESMIVHGLEPDDDPLPLRRVAYSPDYPLLHGGVSCTSSLVTSHEAGGNRYGEVAYGSVSSVSAAGIAVAEDGQMFSFATPTGAPRYIRPISFEYVNHGAGYDAPALASIATTSSEVAQFSLEYEGKVAGVGVLNGGSKYRTPPTVDGVSGATCVISGPVDGITVTSGGSGYRYPPDVSFSRPGLPAKAECRVWGPVDRVKLVSGGSGYNTAPAVVFWRRAGSDVGSGAAATARIEGPVRFVNVTNGGSGYGTVTITGGGGSGATGTAVISGGKITGIEVTNGGSGYGTVTIIGGGGSGATGAAVMSGGKVAGIEVTNGGSGYGTVTITGGGGSGATATAVISGGRVAGIEVTNGGSGYGTVSITGGGGSGATATAVISGGRVTDIEVTNGGSGYGSPPTVVVTGGGGSGVTATAVISGGRVAGIEVTNGGSGYGTVTITGGGGSGATGAAVISGGKVTGVEVTDGGSGYGTVTITGGGGSGVTATAVISGGKVTGVEVTDGGSGYGTVTITGGGGSGATATAVISGGRVTGVEVTNGGSGYGSPPTVTIAGGGGSGATAVATINGSVVEVTLQSGGSEYEPVPLVEFAGGGGLGAAADAVVANCAVTSVKVLDGGTYRASPTVTFTAVKDIEKIEVTDSGSGFTSTPTVFIGGGGGEGGEATCRVWGPVDRVELVSGGSGYNTAPVVVFWRKAGSNVGSGAAATARIEGPVQFVNVTNGGSGYQEPPQVTFSPSGATATAVISGGRVTGIEVTDGGSGYGSPPTVAITGGGGSGATAVATINGSVVEVTLQSGGSEYEPVPLVEFAGGGGFGAAADAVINGSIRDIAVKKRGHHYARPPRVLFLGGGGGYAEAEATLASPGSGAQATATINGSVIYVTVPENQEGTHQRPPVVTCTRSGQAPEGATDAVLKAKLLGKVTSISVTSGGQWYVQGGTTNLFGREKPTDVTLVGFVYGSNSTTHPGGTGVAQESPETGGGPIQSVTLDGSLGQKLFYSPPVAISNDSYWLRTVTCLTLGAVAVQRTSSNRITSETENRTDGSMLVGRIVKFLPTIPPLASGLSGLSPQRYYSESPELFIEDVTSGGSTIVAVGDIQNRYFPDAPWPFDSGYSITTHGNEHTSLATVSCRNGVPPVWGSPAEAEAVVSVGGAVSSINVTEPSSGYSRPPFVFILGGGGHGAVAGTPVLGQAGEIVSIPITSGGSGYSQDNPPVVAIVDRELETHRDAAVQDWIRNRFAKSVFTNWFVEYIKTPDPRQESRDREWSLEERYSGGAPGHRLLPLYLDNGYVESVWLSEWSRSPPRPYQAGTNPAVTFHDACTEGLPEEQAEVTAKVRLWKDVYSSNVGNPSFPESEKY